jgi:hypothetical protein
MNKIMEGDNSSVVNNCPKIRTQKWKHIRDGEIPIANMPLILSDGKSIYAGFYGESFFKTKFHAFGTNAHIKYWMLAPDLPNIEMK